MEDYKYYIRPVRQGKEYPWEEVSKEEFCKLERQCGFRPKLPSTHPEYMTTPATGSFSNSKNGWEGKTEYIPKPELPDYETFVLTTEMVPVPYVQFAGFKKRLDDMVELVEDLEDGEVLRGFSNMGFDGWLLDMKIVIPAGFGYSTRRKGPNFNSFHDFITSLQYRWLEEQEEENVSDQSQEPESPAN